jgi:transposase-like protein
MRKIITTKTKATVVLEALKEQQTYAALGSTHSVHPIQIGQWTKKVRTELHTLFDKDNSQIERINELEQKVDELHRIIGTRDEELAWLQKKIARTHP